MGEQRRFAVAGAEVTLPSKQPHPTSATLCIDMGKCLDDCTHETLVGQAPQQKQKRIIRIHGDTN